MKKLAVLFAILCVVGVANADNTAFIAGQGIHTPGSDTDPCAPAATVVQNHDGTTENAFTWQLQGVVAPDYGAFAEGYTAAQLPAPNVCGVELYLTRWGSMTGSGTVDLYVWEYDVAMDNPGNVLAQAAGVSISGVAMWPTVSTLDYAVPNATIPVDGVFVGYWPGSFAGVLANFGCAMDQNGVGGAPRTNIAPGIGYPTGWNNPSVAGYALQAFGLGPWVNTVGPIPVQDSSWGQIKNLYN